MTLKTERGKHKKYLPYAFTEQGVAMLSGILNSDIAINMNEDLRGLKGSSRLTLNTLIQ